MLYEVITLVYWRQPQSVREYFKQIVGYARGDVEARFKPHLTKIASIFGRYVVFLFFPFLWPIYLLYPLFKFRRQSLTVAEYLLLPMVQVVITSYSIHYTKLYELKVGRHRNITLVYFY